MIQRFGIGVIHRRRVLKRRAARLSDQVVAYVTFFLEQVRLALDMLVHADRGVKSSRGQRC